MFPYVKALRLRNEEVDEASFPKERYADANIISEMALVPKGKAGLPPKRVLDLE